MLKLFKVLVIASLLLVEGTLFAVPSMASDTSATDHVILQLRWQHQFQFAGYYAAQWNGYFADEGFDVDIRPAFRADGTVMNAVDEVESGRADFGVGAADILLARDKGQDLRLVASLFQRSAVEFYTRTDTQVRTPVELTKLKLFRRQGDLLDIELQAMLAAEGVHLSQTGLLPPNKEVSADDLLKGSYDVVPGYLGSIPYYASKEGKTLRTIQPIEYGIDFYGDSLFTSGQTVLENPERVERFRRAVIRGWSYALQHPDELSARIAKQYPQGGQSYAEQLSYNKNQAQQVLKLTYYPVVAVGNINSFRWQEMSRILKKLGMVAGDPTADNFIFDYTGLKQKQAEAFQRSLILGFGIFTALLIVAWMIHLNVKNRQLSNEILQKSEAQARLLRSNQRYESIFNNTVVGITLTDPEGRILQTNDRWNELTGYNFDELIGHPIYDLMVTSERMKAHAESDAGFFDAGFITERLYKRKDGSNFWGRLYINGIPDSDSDSKVYLGMIVDITAERMEQEALQRSEARFRELVREIAGRYGMSEVPAEPERKELALKLEKINMELEKLFKNEMDENRRKEVLLIHQARQAAMGEMVAGIAHQWRQPLHSLSLVLGNLKDAWYHGELDDEGFDRSIIKSRGLIARMSETIDMFRDFLKPDKTMEPFSLNNTIDSVLHLLEDALRTRSVQLEMASYETYTVYGYPSQLSQVLFNLLNNAMDALADIEPLQRRIQIVIEPDHELQHVSVRICDTGGGIDEDLMGKVFEPYVTTKDQQQGTGLGLYISRLIVENVMKGTLTIENMEGGLCATVTLPLSLNGDAEKNGGDLNA